MTLLLNQISLYLEVVLYLPASFRSTRALTGGENIFLQIVQIGQLCRFPEVNVLT